MTNFPGGIGLAVGRLERHQVVARNVPMVVSTEGRSNGRRLQSMARTRPTSQKGRTRQVFLDAINIMRPENSFKDGITVNLDRFHKCLSIVLGRNHSAAR